MKRVLVVLAMLLVVGAITAHMLTHTAAVSLELERFDHIAKGIAAAPRLVLHEGLPDPLTEAAAHEMELRGNGTVRMQGYDFHAGPLTPAKLDIDSLRRLCGARDSYRPYHPEKPCGAYHPDYALVWHGDGKTWQLLISFACHEMKLYGPEGEVHVDIKPRAFDAMHDILVKYRRESHGMKPGLGLPVEGT